METVEKYSPLPKAAITTRFVCTSIVNAGTCTVNFHSANDDSHMQISGLAIANARNFEIGREYDVNFISSAFVDLGNPTAGGK